MRFRVTMGLAAIVVTVSLLLSGATPTAAHTPHDHILDVAVRSDDSETVFAVSRARLMRSTDGGATWTRLANGLDHRTVPYALATGPADPDVVYLAFRGGGLYRSDDGGDSWAPVPGRDDMASTNLVDVAVSPFDASQVAVIGEPRDPLLLVSGDDGTSWTTVDTLSDVTAVAFSPVERDVVVVGGADGTVHRSLDGGVTFSQWEAGPAGPTAGISAIAFDGRRTYVATDGSGVFEAEGNAPFESLGDELDDVSVVDLVVTADALWASTSRQTVFRSTDAGSSWDEVGDGLTTDPQADTLERPDFGSLAAAPGPSGTTMWVAGFDGLFGLPAGSNAWEYVATQSSTIIAGLDLSPNYSEDQTVAVATYINGAKLSTDAGESWTDISNGLAHENEWRSREDYVARLTGITFRPTADGNELVAGLRGLYAESFDRGATWDVRVADETLVPGEFPPDYLLPAYSGTYEQDGITIYGTDSGRVFEHDRSTGELSLLAELDAEITAIVASPEFAEDQVVVNGSAFGVGISRDGGSTWDAVGDLDRGVVSLALSPDFGDDDTIWAGTMNGLYVTTDLETWDLVDPFDTSAFVEAVAAASDTNATTLLVSVRGRGLFRSVDSGATFEPVAPDLLAQQVVFNSFYHPITEPIVFSPDFAQDRTVFGLAEDRIYRSTDSGDSWVTIEIAATLHDPDDDPDAALLSVPRPPGLPDAMSSDGPDRRIETPIGTLTPIRIAFAATLALAMVVLLSIRLPAPLNRSRDRLSPNWFVTVGLALVVFVGAAAILVR